MRESQLLFQKMIPEETAIVPLFAGARLRKRAHRFKSEDGQDCLTNIYSAEIDETACRFGLDHSPEPQPPRAYLDGQGDCVVMNAGFMYTVDSSPIWPDNFTYHLQVADRKLIGLPTKTKYALVASNGRLRPELVEARGKLRVGNMDIDWVGSNEPDAESAESGGAAVCFGPVNQGLIKHDEGVLPDPGRMMVQAKSGSKLVLFGLALGLEAKIYDITDGRLPYLASAFILRVADEVAADLRPGDTITHWRVGGLAPDNAEDAVTVGVMLTDSPEELERRRQADRLAITRRNDGRTPFYGQGDSQKGRTCLFRTADGRIHFLIADARPKVPGQHGLTLRELAAFLYDNHDVDWALSLDGGQSSKICWSSAGSGGILGNLHYINKLGIEPRWDGVNGRPVTSCVIVRPLRDR
jgi:hypothetical protein